MPIDLISSIAAGEGDAEKELFATYSKGVHIILRRMLGRWGATGEAHADTFRQAIAKIRSREFEDPQKLPAFLATLARFRGGASREPWQPAESFQNVIREQNAALVRELLAGYTSEDVRRVLFQYYVAGIDLDSIASQAGIKREKCSNIIADAREKFTPLYEKRIQPDVKKQ